jgi:hypothetical protein
MKRILKLMVIALVMIGMAASCGSSRKYGKNPNRHKSKGACGVNVRY